MKALQVVELVGGAARFQSSEMHGLSMLACAIDPKQTLESVQEYTNKESLTLAQDMVSRGLAKWRDHIDGDRVSEVLRDWQNDKNAVALRKIFGDSQACGTKQGFDVVRENARKNKRMSATYKVGQTIVAKISGVPQEAKIRAVLDDTTEGTKLIVDFRALQNGDGERARYRQNGGLIWLRR